VIKISIAGMSAQPQLFIFTTWYTVARISIDVIPSIASATF